MIFFYVLAAAFVRIDEMMLQGLVQRNPTIVQVVQCPGTCKVSMSSLS